jgi:plasmid stabilization system protein ParE
MKISWMRQATANIVDAHEFIYESNPGAADRQRLLILEGVYRLAQFPAMGREGRMEGTRELVIAGTPYIAVYRNSCAFHSYRGGDARRPALAQSFQTLVSAGPRSLPETSRPKWATVGSVPGARAGTASSPLV